MTVLSSITKFSSRKIAAGLGRISLRRVDLDDICAKITKNFAAQESKGTGQVENAIGLQQHGRFVVIEMSFVCFKARAVASSIPFKELPQDEIS
jgi:hypothetical protein